MDSIKSVKMQSPLICKGLQKFKDSLFVSPFKHSSEFVILMILKVKDQERKKNFFEDNKSFLLIHVLKSNNSKTLRNVITGITSQNQLDTYSICLLSEKIVVFGNNGRLFNQLSWIKDAKNVKCRRKSVSGWEFAKEHSKNMQKLTPFLSKLSLGAPEVMGWGGGEGPGLLVAVLGWSGRAPTPTLEAFDPAGDTWRYLPQEDFACRAYGGVVLCGGDLFVVGGFDGRRCRRSCLRFDGRRWHRAPPLSLPRCYVAAVALGGRVCALGGCDGRRRFRSCERLGGGRWEPFADMLSVRSDASATVHLGRIFVSGGFDGDRVLSCAEVYCARADQWSLVPHPLTSPRSGHALIAFKGSLWAIGGFDGHKRLNTVESLEEGAGWVSRCPLRHPRSNFGAAVLHDQLYVVGGYNGARTFSEVERLEEGGRGWRRARPLNKHRSALGVCVLAHHGCHATEPPVVQAVRVASP